MTPCGNEDIQSFRIGYRSVLAWQGICFSGIFQSGCKPRLLLCAERDQHCSPAASVLLQLLSILRPASVLPLLPQAESLLCPMSLGSLLVFALNLNPWISTCSAAIGWALQPPLGTHLCLMELVSSLCPSWIGSGVPCSAQTVKLPPGSVHYIPLLLVSLFEVWFCCLSPLSVVKGQP